MSCGSGAESLDIPRFDCKCLDSKPRKSGKYVSSLSQPMSRLSRLNFGMSRFWLIQFFDDQDATPVQTLQIETSIKTSTRSSKFSRKTRRKFQIYHEGLYHENVIPILSQNMVSSKFTQEIENGKFCREFRRGSILKNLDLLALKRAILRYYFEIVHLALTE